MTASSSTTTCSSSVARRAGCRLRFLPSSSLIRGCAFRCGRTCAASISPTRWRSLSTRRGGSSDFRALLELAHPEPREDEPQLVLAVANNLLLRLAVAVPAVEIHVQQERIDLSDVILHGGDELLRVQRID